MPRTVFTLVSDFFYTVDTEQGDGAANFAELDSDYSEPGKHVWTFDMMSVFHDCLSGFLMTCLYKHLWMLYFMQSKLQVSFEIWCVHMMVR